MAAAVLLWLLVVTEGQEEEGEFVAGTFNTPWLYRMKPPAAAVVVAAMLLWLLVMAEGQEEGEFVAGTFIITQEALDEAPYRYSTFFLEVRVLIKFSENIKHLKESVWQNVIF